jgi:hypothetical protein
MKFKGRQCTRTAPAFNGGTPYIPLMRGGFTVRVKSDFDEMPTTVI